MKTFKVYWNEVIIHHRFTEVEANNKGEVIKMVKNLEVCGDPVPNTPDEFGKVIDNSIHVVREK